MRKIFYSSRSNNSKMLNTRNFMRTQTPQKLDATLVPSLMILSILYTADAENNRCTWSLPPLQHKRNTDLGLYTSLFQSGWRPTDSSSIDQNMSFYGAPPSDVAVYLTTAPSRLIDDTEVRETDTMATLESNLISAACMTMMIHVGQPALSTASD